MLFTWITWYIIQITGAFFLEIEANVQNSTKAWTESSLDDNDPTHPDYIDRDYLNVDYYDDREGRSLDTDHHHHDDPEDDGNSQNQDREEFMIKQLKSTIPGTPGVDYALYQSVPDTTFQCGDQKNAGFYGDVESQCQVFHICQEDDRQDSFICPIGTVFNQISLVCDWWFNFKCEDTPKYYHLNNKFHSPAGHMSMKDTMEQMKNFQGKNGMKMIMKMHKVHKNLHNRQNMIKSDFGRRSEGPRSRNLFMLGMRRKALERLRTQKALQRSSDETVTESTLPTVITPLALKEMSSAGYLDISLSEFSATTNSSYTDVTINKVSISESVNNVTDTQLTEILSHTPELETPLKSSVNLTDIEMVVNSSFVRTLKLDHTDLEHLESSSVTEPTSTEAYTTTERNENLNTRHEEKSYNTQHTQGEKTSKFEPKAEKLYSEIDINNDNGSISSPTVLFTEPTTLPSSEPFNHENNFIIGNDTHISVSVTIHSKSSRSKLQWKRLPGIKRIRKIRFKNFEEITSAPNLSTEITYRKRNNEVKPKSRIMWIPAKKDVLERKMDWKTFLETRNYGTISSVSIHQDQHQKLKALDKNVIESKGVLPVNVADKKLNKEENYTKENSPSTAIEEFHNFSTDISSNKNINEKLGLLKKISEVEDNYNNKENASDDIKVIEHATLQPNLSENLSEGIENENKTVYKNISSNSYENSSHESTKVPSSEKSPSTLTLFSYGNSDSETKGEFGRKTVLGASSSEQWTVKYDSEPDCSDNTENSKASVKGWSVIIDSGSITKEKTVKKRGCIKKANDNEFTMRKNFNSGKNSGDRDFTFGGDTSHKPSHFKTPTQSTDQRYWFNLVKNWLRQSPVTNQEVSRIDPDEYSEQNWMSDEHVNKHNKHHSILSQKQDLNRGNPSNFEPSINDRNSFTGHESNRNKINKKFNFSKKNKDSNFLHSKTFLKNDGNQRKNSIPSTKPKLHSDLQMERSDWFQSSQKMKDMRHETNRPRQNAYLLASQDYNDWSSKTSSTDDEWDTQKDDLRDRKSNRRDWSVETRDDRVIQDSVSSRKRNAWNYRRNDWTPEEKSDKNTWTKSSTKAEIDWSVGENKNLDPRKDYPSVSWKQERKPRDFSDNDWMINEKSQDKSISGGRSKRHRNWPPSSTTDTRGRSVSDEWNWSSERGVNMKANDGNRGGWSNNNAKDVDWSADEEIQKRIDDWKSNKPNLPRNRPTDDKFKTSNKNEGFWIPDESNEWRGDSDSPWLNDESRGDKGWQMPTSKNKDNKSRDGSDWNSEENKWEKGMLNTDVWNQNKNRNVEESKGDWNSQPNKQDWSQESRGGRNKGFPMRRMESGRSKDWSNDEFPSWVVSGKMDKTKNVKTPRRSGNRWPNQPSRRTNNNKGESYPGFKQSTMPSSWSSNNRDEWKDDEEIWGTGNSGNTFHRGTRNNKKKPGINNPPRKSDFPTIQEEWFSQEDISEDVWGSQKGKGDSSRGSSRTDKEWATRKKMESDWSSEPDIWPNHTPSVKGRTDDKRVSNKGNIDNNSKKGANVWPDKSSTENASKGSNRMKGTKNSLASSKTNNKGNMRTPQTPPIKGSPMMSWKHNEDSAKNFTNNKGDEDVKKIVWSPQINSDGKPGNGWVPITLRPELRAKINRTQKDWDAKDSSSAEENLSDKDSWESTKSNNKGSMGTPQIPPIKGSQTTSWKNNEDSAKIQSWNSEISQYSESTSEETTVTTETNSPTLQASETSFSHLFYIPVFNNRYKRENNYHRKTGKNYHRYHLRTRDIPKSYKIIKSGEILDDASKDNSKFFLATAGIIVEDLKHSNKRRHLQTDFERQKNQTAQNSPTQKSSRSLVVTNTRKNLQPQQKPGKNWDTFPKESIISESWSSPFDSHNSSASGWIPVTTFKPLRNKNLTELNASEPSSQATSGKYVKIVEPKFHIHTKNILDYMAETNESQNLSLNSQSNTFDILSHSKESNYTKNETKVTDIESNGKEMKVGNKTLRILSFSDVMKQLGKDNTHRNFRNSHASDYNSTSWNVPITTDPITYSLKVVDPSKEVNENSNSWIFASNGNKTKHAWILIGKDNTTESKMSNNSDSLNINSSNAKTEKFKIIVGNKTTVLDESEINYDSTANQELKGPKNTHHYSPGNWDSDSDWRPVIRTLGKVISYNRTLQLGKESKAVCSLE